MDTRPVGVWLSCSVLVLACGTASAADEAAEAPEVPVARPIVREVTDHEYFTGRTDAVQRVEVRARVSGYLLKAPFREGAEVKKGDVLFEIDARPYQAEAKQAEAKLRLAQASLKLAEVKLQRAKGQEAEQATAERDEAKARVLAAEAVREVARLNLDFTRIVAPIDGRISRRLLDAGNLVRADETTLATLVRLDPVHVFFDIDEVTLLRLRRSINESGAKDAKLPVAVGLAGEEDYPRRGEADFSDNRVNPDTGTLRARAVLPNKDQLLLPGLFVRVRMAMGAPYKALLVRSEAVMADEGMKIVYVVNDKNTIERRRVEVGPEHDGLRVVRRGLKADERVVVGRQQRLRAGQIVRPVEGERRPAPQEPGPAKPSVKIRPAPRDPGPVIFVEAEYPGANAAVVADTVAAPIEEQVNGVEKAQAMRSRCTNEGKYTLAITFARGADPDMCQVLVQNRVALAAPVLPFEVQNAGVTVRKRMPGARMLVTLHSAGGRYDSVYLSNYARIQIQDELLRLPGVAGATLVGPQEYGLRVWLDPEKLTARNLTAGEVVKVLKEMDVQAAPGRAPKGQGEVFQLELKTKGKLLDLEAMADVVLKTDGKNGAVRLKDVANLELGARRRDESASLDGKPAVALAVYTLWGVRPRDLRDAVRAKVRELRERLPDGVELAVSFDFTEDRPVASERLLLDLDLPVGASAERVQAILRRGEGLLREAPGVRHTLALSDNPFDPFDGGPSILVELERKANRVEVERAIRKRLDEIKEMTVRIRDLSGPDASAFGAYPVNLAVRGPDPAAMRAFARKLAERMRQSKELTDVAVNAASLPRPSVTVDIDRRRAADLGVSLKAISDTLDVYLGALHVSDFNRFGRTWRVEIQTKPGSGDWAKDIKMLQVRNSRNEIVSLGKIISIRDTNSPQAIDRLDGRPMIEITANLTAEAAADKVRSLVEKLAGEARTELRLSADYGVSWLREIKTAR